MQTRSSIVGRALGTRFLEPNKGATAVEYALILSAIAAVIILTVITLGAVVAARFQDFLTLWQSL